MSNAVLTIEDIQKSLTDLTKYKDQIETEYFRVLGKLQLLRQQIELLQDKESKKPTVDEKTTKDNTEAQPK